MMQELERCDSGLRSFASVQSALVMYPIYTFGNEEQKSRWLPAIARGEGGWCMGYSEPGAGSDLASLSTRAVRVGDSYVVNGRKTWTSDATECDYIFALVRTDPDAPQHEGISLVLIDMNQPGVQVRPIRLISGPNAVKRL